MAAYVDPADRDVALHMAEDHLGYTWLMFGDRRLSLGGPHRPGDVDGMGAFRQRLIDGLPSDLDVYEFTASYSDPDDRIRQLDRAGFNASIMFPNYGIAWERLLPTIAGRPWPTWPRGIGGSSRSPGAGKGRLFPVATSPFAISTGSRDS